MHLRPRPRQVLTLTAVMLLVSASGCSRVKDVVAVPKSPDRVSLKSYPLSLAFGAGPNEASDAVELTAPEIPAGELTMPALGFDDFLQDDFPPIGPPPVFEEPPNPCPEPDAGVFAERRITPDVTVVPDAGTYLFKQLGILEITGLAKVPLQGLTTRTVRNLTVTSAEGARLEFDYDLELVTGLRRQVLKLHIRSATDPRGSGATQTTTPANSGGIFLRGIETVVGNDRITFSPALPVKIFPFPAEEGLAISDTGVDLSTGETLSVAGTIGQKDRLEGCGEVVDAWTTANMRWTFQKPSTKLPPVTDPKPPTETRVYEYDYSIAPQYGGILVGDHFKTVTPEFYGPIAVSLDMTSVIGRMAPTPENKK